LERQGVRATKVKVFVLFFAVMALLVACAPRTQETSESSATDGDDPSIISVDFTFSADSDCMVCHETESASLTDAACPASDHATLTCTDCHTDIDGLTTAHSEVTYGDRTATRLKVTEIDDSDDSACLNDACHTGYEALAEKTASSTVLTDSNGTVVNPHALPESEDHETVDCGNCHDIHSSDDIGSTARKACLSCHHMDVYECYTCHE
jgi:hypothetical protein